MPREQLPENLYRFVLVSIPSVPYLEALLVFRGLQGAGLTVRELAARLYMPEKPAFDLLVALRDAGIVEAVAGGDTHRYAAAGDLAATLDQLAAHYSRDLIRVTEVIHSKTDRKAHQFADAFKWKKES